MIIQIEIVEQEIDSIVAKDILERIDSLIKWHNLHIKRMDIKKEE